MAAKKSKDGGEGGGGTQRVNVWLTPEQVEWLKSKKNVSQTVRALVTEAISLDRLKQSVTAGKKSGKAPVKKR